jgi:hypothetical protein
MLIHNAEVTGSLKINNVPFNSGSFSGSFRGDGSQLTGITGASTASYVEYNNVGNKPALVSSSAQIVGYGIFATTGSNQFNGSQAITGSLTVTGQVVAQTLNVQQVTSSIVYSSGSNIFGNSLGNTQQFTGSVSVTGSLAVNNIPTILGSITSGQVAFGTATNTIGGENTLFWDATNDRLGIGTATPTFKLDILGSDNSQLRLDSSDTFDTTLIMDYNGGGATNRVRIRNTSGSLAFNTNNSVERWRITSTGILQSNGAQTIQTSTGNLTLATAGGNGNIVLSPNGTGNVGIETASPRSTADVNGILTVGDGNPPTFNLYRNVALDNNASFGSINFGARYDSTNYGIGASISTNSVGVWSASNYGGNLIFSTTPQNSTTLTERMRITSGGALLVNRSSIVNDTVYKFVVRNSTNVNIGFGIQGGEASIECFNDALSAGTPLRIYGEPLQLYTSGTEKMRITSGGNVGIGTTSPSARLEINAASASSILRVLGGGDGTGGGKGNIRSGDQGGTNFWDFGRDNLTTGDFVITEYGGSPILRLRSSSGAATFSSTVSATSYGGTSASFTDGNVSIIGGNYLVSNNFPNAGELRGILSKAYYQTNYPTSILFGDPGVNNFNVITFNVSNADTTGTEKMRITGEGYLRMATGGIQFNGDTAAANALDDYEEGTFTPTVEGTGAVGTGTYARQIGVYTKIGNIVTINVWLQWSSHTGTGDMKLSNLPFTSIGTNNFRASGTFGWVDNLTLTANNVIGMAMTPATTSASVTQYPAGGGAASGVLMDTAANLHFAMTYQTS